MVDVNKILEEEKQAMNKFKDLTPEKIAPFKEWVKALKKEEALDSKQRELILVALSVLSQCKWCIVTHVKRALDNGVSEDEVLHSAWLAVLMGGGPSLMESQLVIKTVEEFGKD